MTDQSAFDAAFGKALPRLYDQFGEKMTYLPPEQGASSVAGVLVDITRDDETYDAGAGYGAMKAEQTIGRVMQSPPTGYVSITPKKNGVFTRASGAKLKIDSDPVLDDGEFILDLVKPTSS